MSADGAIAERHVDGDREREIVRAEIAWPSTPVMW